MGGSGSGQWYRWDSKSTTGDYLCLSITRLFQQGFIRKDGVNSGTLVWSRGFDDEKIASIGYTSNMTADHPAFNVRYTSDGESYSYPIYLDWTEPHYGGKRWWFKCPAMGCGRRVGKLYGGNIFACRHCHNLAYESQREHPGFRFLSRAQRIHQELGGDGYVDWEPPKPKGMHWKTYERKLAEMNHYHNAALGSMCMRLGIAEFSEEALLRG